MIPERADVFPALVLQLHSLAFFLLALTALLTLRRGEATGLGRHVGWLALFAGLHGLREFFPRGVSGDAEPWQAPLDIALLFASFLALLEFGRRLWNDGPGRGRLTAPPVYGAVGLGTAALAITLPDSGPAIAAHCLLGAPAAALAAGGLFCQARTTMRVEDTVAIIRWLYLATLAMLSYAVLTLFEAPGVQQLFPGLPGGTAAPTWSGLPGTMHTLSALLLAAGLIGFHRRTTTLTATTLRRVTDRLNGYVYRCRNDRNWTVTFMSGGGEILTGHSPEAFMAGRISFADLIHPDDRERAWDTVQAAVAERRDFQLHYRLIDRAGTVRWCYEEGRGVFDSRGELQYLEGLVRNDEARQAAQEALERERDFNKRLIDTAPVIILLLDPQGRIDYVNRWFERLSGYRLDELRGREWFTSCVPPRKEAHVRGLFAGAIRDEAVSSNIEPIATRDGSERIIEWYADALRDGDGRVSGLLAIGMDVTERESLEDRLRRLNEDLEQRVAQRTAELERELHRNEAILGTAIEGFFAVDGSGRIRRANPAFCAMLGYGEAELLALSLPDIEAAETPEETAAHIQRVLARGHDRFDTVHRRKDGSTLEVEISVSRVQLDEEPMFFAFARDISLRKAAVAALSRARDEAVRTTAAKNDFLSRMSHELRTPLNAILGFTQLLEMADDDPLSTGQGEQVREIHLAGEHLLTLVNETLDLARIESGHLEFKREPVALGAAIEHCLVQLETTARQRGIAPSFAGGGDFVVAADPVRVKQVLLNLLSNAIKYNSEGGTLAVACAAAAEGRVRVSVRDTGRGLSDAEQARLFRPFERLESAYEAIEGTGIGLALAKQLVEGMGGRIGVDSTPGEGSTFWFELPRSDGEGESA
ncbi:MAG: sensor histidine kinase [Pseudohaliea sp.]